MLCLSVNHLSNGSPPSFGFSRWLFLRLLGVIYLAAFASAFLQLDGLIGSRGILPAGEYLSRMQEVHGDGAVLRAPTVFWLDCTDGTLKLVCIGGMVLSGLLILGLVPILALAGLWALYLSLVVVGQEFFGYQWDGLLLETGLYAVFFAPMGLWPSVASEAPPSPVMRWMLRWLLFRLMFASGIAKLLSGDPTWRDFTALCFHYETQPLPTWVSWHMHQLPTWLHAAMVGLVFVAELVLPVLLWLPRRCRHVACLGIAAFHIALLFTGNFGFFNLLGLALCVSQLDDSAFPRWMRRRVPDYGEFEPRGRNILLVPIAVVLFVLSLTPFLVNAGLATGPASYLVDAHQRVAPFHSVNSYGLFAVMTTERREIVIEGSDDGQTWLPYEFSHKPGDVNRRPSFTGPHLPRLDWQMWFAALSDERASPWVSRFLDRLLEGSPEILALLERNPFPARPPRFLRATLYEYRFSDAETRNQTGVWWWRQRVGPWTPLRINSNPPPGAGPA